MYSCFVWQGMTEWRNIQDVIRSTFKALHEVIKAQGDAISKLEAQVQVTRTALVALSIGSRSRSSCLNQHSMLGTTDMYREREIRDWCTARAYTCPYAKAR